MTKVERRQMPGEWSRQVLPPGKVMSRCQGLYRRSRQNLDPCDVMGDDQSWSQDWAVLIIDKGCCKQAKLFSLS